MSGIYRFLVVAFLFSSSATLAQEVKLPVGGKPALDRFGDPLPPNALARLGTVRFRESSITRVQFSPDGKMVATFGGGNEVTLWDAETGRRMRGIAKREASILSARFSPDGKILVSGDYDGVLQFHKTATGEHIRSIKAAASYNLAFSPNGKFLATAWRPNNLQIRNAETGDLIQEKKAGRGIDQIDFSSDSKLLAVWCQSGEIEFWDVETGKLATTLPSSDRSGRFAQDPRRVLSVSGDHVMRVRDIDTGKAIHEFKQDGFFMALPSIPRAK